MDAIERAMPQEKFDKFVADFRQSTVFLLKVDFAAVGGLIALMGIFKFSRAEMTVVYGAFSGAMLHLVVLIGLGFITEVVLTVVPNWGRNEARDRLRSWFLLLMMYLIFTVGNAALLGRVYAMVEKLREVGVCA